MRSKLVVSAGRPADRRRALFELRFVVVPAHAAAELNLVLPELHRVAEEHARVVRGALVHRAGVADRAVVRLVWIGMVKIRGRRGIRRAQFVLRGFVGVDRSR